MKNKKIQQALILGLWSFLAVTPLLLTTGPNVVTLTYQEGANRFFSGINPYSPPSPGVDGFFYPPFFAAAWGVFDFLGPIPKILLWVFINSFVFWLGISEWLILKKNQSKWLWFFLVCVAVELDVSLRYQQSNAVVAGLILIALARLRESKNLKAAILLALATHLKVFPVLFALVLALPFHFRFAVSYLSALLLWFILPMSIVGPHQAFSLQWQELSFTTGDFSKRQLLDIAACLDRLGYEAFGKILQRTILILGSLILILYRAVTQNRKFEYGFWYSSFVSLLLLVTPKTESPTFVWAAPAYLFLVKDSSKRTLAILALIGLFMTLIYSSAFPREWVYWFRWNWTSKTLAVLALWLLASGKLWSSHTSKSS